MADFDEALTESVDEPQEHPVAGADWKHPTGKIPKSICILGLGATSADWHNAHTPYNPQVPKVDEVWAINKGIRTVRADMAFIMDDLIDEARQSARYAEEIAAYDKPYLTSRVDAQVAERFPAAIEYPLKDVLTFWGAQLNWMRSGKKTIDAGLAFELGRREAGYFKNSVPYMLAYAGFIGVKQIAMFGCDYTFPGTQAREAGRANAEFWVGACRFGLGIQFKFPSRTTLMDTCGEELKGYYGFNGRQPF